MSHKILFVDDEPNILTALRRQLHNRFRVDTALGPEAGLKEVRNNGPYAVVVSDLRMPGMDGVQFLAAVHDRSPDTVRVMLTGYADVDAAIAAVNEGNVFRFLVKPVQPNTLVQALDASLQQHQLIISERELLQKTLGESVKVMTSVLSLASPVAFGRANRVTRYVRQIADRLMIPNAWQFELAALLSQIGCVALPADILEKVYQGQELSAEEERMFALHPIIGHDLLANIPRLESIAKMIQRQDGSDTQEGSARRDPVSFGAELLRTALDFDTLTSNGVSTEEALAKMRRGRYESIFLTALEGPDASYGAMTDREVSVSGLDTRMILGQDVRTRSGSLLVSEGQEVTLPVLNLLRCWSERGDIPEPIRVRIPIDSAAQAA